MTAWGTDATIVSAFRTHTPRVPRTPPAPGPTKAASASVPPILNSGNSDAAMGARVTDSSAHPTRSVLAARARPSGLSVAVSHSRTETAIRSETLPDLPTIGDFVTGYEASTWNGVCAPKNTPADIVDRLNREINAGLADPTLKARLAEMGAWTLPGSPADCGNLIAEEIEKWAKVVRAGNIKPE